MTSQGSPHTRFKRALATRNLFLAEIALREIGTPNLLDALDYLALMAEQKPERFPRAPCAGTGGLSLKRRR